MNASPGLGTILCSSSGISSQAVVTHRQLTIFPVLLSMPTNQRSPRLKRESGCHDPLRENFCALQSATSNASGVEKLPQKGTKISNEQENHCEFCTFLWPIPIVLGEDRVWHYEQSSSTRKVCVMDVSCTSAAIVWKM